MIDLTDKIRYYVKHYAEDQILMQVKSQVWLQIDRQVWSMVEGHVWDMTDEQVQWYDWDQND